MEKLDKQTFEKLLKPSYSVHILPYYGYMHETFVLMSKLCKKSKEIMEKYEHVYEKRTVKQEIRLSDTFDKTIGKYYEPDSTSKCSKDYIRFFTLNVRISATRPLKKFKGMLRHFKRLQDKDPFNQKFSENAKKIAQLTKKLEKVNEGVRRQPGKKKELIEQLRILNSQK